MFSVYLSIHSSIYPFIHPSLPSQVQSTEKGTVELGQIWDFPCLLTSTLAEVESQWYFDSSSSDSGLILHLAQAIQ